MRIADKMNYNQMDRNIQKNRSEMQDLQNQAATQKRITKPSDDPTAATRVLQMRTEDRSSQQFVKNISLAKSFLEYTDQSMSELSEVLNRLKELAIQQASDAGASDQTRRTVSGEVEQLYSQMIQIGNRKLGDRYIFGGFKTTQPPFNREGAYAGDDGEIKIQINKDAFIGMNVSGEKIFLGENLGPDGLIRVASEVPRNVDEIRDFRQQEQLKKKEIEDRNEEPLPLRAPSNTQLGPAGKAYESVPEASDYGVNLLRTVKEFEVALRVNDKAEIQSAIDKLDQGLQQVINARAQVGSRISSLTSGTESLQKALVENKITTSQLEDADLFQVVSDINRSDSTLKATLETSSKVSNLSLLDFLK